MLEEAWKREHQLKRCINAISEAKADAIQSRAEAIRKATGRVREEVERWQMRNEELE